MGVKCTPEAQPTLAVANSTNPQPRVHRKIRFKPNGTPRKQNTLLIFCATEMIKQRPAAYPGAIHSYGGTELRPSLLISFWMSWCTKILRF